MKLYWVLLVVLFPVFVATYFVSLSMVGGWVFDYEYKTEHTGWLYAPFVGTLAVAVLAVFPPELGFQLQPYYLLFLGVGAGMYRLDVAVMARRTASRTTRGNQALYWLVPVLAIAPAEEVLFRGVLTTVLTEYGAVAYVAASSVLFGITHYRDGRHEVVFKTVNGALYCLLYLTTGSLLSPIFAHVGYNVAYLWWATGGPTRKQK